MLKGAFNRMSPKDRVVCSQSKSLKEPDSGQKLVLQLLPCIPSPVVFFSLYLSLRPTSPTGFTTWGGQLQACKNTLSHTQTNIEDLRILASQDSAGWHEHFHISVYASALIRISTYTYNNNNHSSCTSMCLDASVCTYKCMWTQTF